MFNGFDNGLIQEVLDVKAISFEELFAKMSISDLEKVEEIYNDNSANPTGTLSTALRPYMKMHPLFIQLQEICLWNPTFKQFET